MDLLFSFASPTNLSTLDFSSLYKKFFNKGQAVPYDVDNVIEPKDYYKNYNSIIVILLALRGFGILRELKL